MGSSWQLVPKGFFHSSFCCSFLLCAGIEFRLGAELPFNSQWISLFCVVTVPLKAWRGRTLSWITTACGTKCGTYLKCSLHLVVMIAFCISVIADIESSLNFIPLFSGPYMLWMLPSSLTVTVTVLLSCWPSFCSISDASMLACLRAFESAVLSAWNSFSRSLTRAWRVRCP